MSLRLGLIGFSDGNAHPYSWSAICNGYSVPHMNNCGFPSIPEYLSSEIWPKAKIHGVSVSHIWTQDKTLSEHIAKTCYIPNIVDNPIEMIGKIDALLLARDDSENHYKFAKPFLESGIPIYIDKPIATSIVGLNSLYEIEKYTGQIFTCSALRYAKELQITNDDSLELGKIKSINAITPKSWAKYAIHIIEPVLNILEENDNISNFHTKVFDGCGKRLSLKLESGITVNYTATGSSTSIPISICIDGSLGSKKYVFESTFSAFKLAISDFIFGIKSKTCRSSKIFNERVVSIIEMGLTNE